MGNVDETEQRPGRTNTYGKKP